MKIKTNRYVERVCKYCLKSFIKYCRKDRPLPNYCSNPCKYKNLGGKHPFYTKEEVRKLRQFCHLPLNEIAAHLPNRTEASIHSKLVKLGLKKKNKRLSWSKKELDLLEKPYSIEYFQKKLQRPKHTIIKKVRELKPEREDFLKESYISAQELQQLFGITEKTFTVNFSPFLKKTRFKKIGNKRMYSKERVKYIIKNNPTLINFKKTDQVWFISIFL